MKRPLVQRVSRQEQTLQSLYSKSLPEGVTVLASSSIVMDGHTNLGHSFYFEKGKHVASLLNLGCAEETNSRVGLIVHPYFHASYYT